MSIVLIIAGCDGRFQKRNLQSEACKDTLMAPTPVDILGYTRTAIHYGDSRLFVIPVSKIKANSEFRFRLIPKVRSKTDGSVDFKKVNVAITSVDDDADTPADWLDVDGSFDADKGVLVVCVPPNLTKDVYKYEVTITDGGNDLAMLDPRADVVH
jgi:hypothetical protein